METRVLLVGSNIDEEVRRTLLWCDNPPSHPRDVLYEGQDFDRADAVARAQQVRADLVRAFRRYFYLQDDQQDAYFWGKIFEPVDENLSLRRPIPIRFSLCANLAATWTLPGYDPLTPEEKRTVSDILKRHGFVWVDGDILRASPYDGAYDCFGSRAEDEEHESVTWWDRFFNYD